MPQKRKELPPRSCEYCGNILQRKMHRNTLEDFQRFKKRKYCGKLCAALSSIKENAGRSAIQKRIQTYKTSNCQICATTKNLQIHHIDLDWRNNDPNNLQTLCDSCHMKLHHQQNRESKEIPNFACKECGKIVRKLKKGYCGMHYQRFKKYGDPLLTKVRENKVYVMQREPIGKSTNHYHAAHPMGFPIGWTDLAPSAIQSSPNVPQLPLSESCSSTSSLLLQSNPESRLANHLFGNKVGIGVAELPEQTLLLQSRNQKAELIEERDRLLNEGNIAPENCWLVTGRVTKTFVKCWYKSREPIFNGRTSRYVGREDSPAAKEARRAIARRNRLRAIAKELKLLEKE